MRTPPAPPPLNTGYEGTPARQGTGGGGGSPSAQVSLSGRPTVTVTAVQSPRVSLFGRREELGSPGIAPRGATAEDLFNAWYFADAEVQSDAFMAIGTQVFKHEHEDRAADRMLSLLLACNGTTRYNVFKIMYDELKAEGGLPDNSDSSASGVTAGPPVGGQGGIDGNTASLIHDICSEGSKKGGTGGDGPSAKRQKAKGGDTSDADDKDEGWSLRAKIAAVHQVDMDTSKLLHERTAPSQVESWYNVKNHMMRALGGPYFGNCGTKPGFRTQSHIDCVLRPQQAFLARPILREAAEYFVICDSATWTKLVQCAKRADITTGNLGIFPEQVESQLFRAFCLFAAFDVINNGEDPCHTVGGVFNVLTAAGHCPASFEAHQKIPVAEARTPYKVRCGYDRWVAYDGFHGDTVGHAMPDASTERVVATGGGGTGGGSGPQRTSAPPKRRQIAGISAADIELVPMCFFACMSNAEILEYQTAKSEKKCLNCFKDGHMGRDCTEPCAWPLCRGKKRHTCQDCKMPKSKHT